MLRHGLEAGDLSDDEVVAIEAHMRTGRPRGSEAFIGALEARTGRTLKRRKPGPKPTRQFRGTQYLIAARPEPA